jgi:hypothetical protein
VFIFVVKLKYEKYIKDLNVDVYVQMYMCMYIYML